MFYDVEPFRHPTFAKKYVLPYSDHYYSEYDGHDSGSTERLIYLCVLGSMVVRSFGSRDQLVGFSRKRTDSSP